MMLPIRQTRAASAEVFFFCDCQVVWVSRDDDDVHVASAPFSAYSSLALVLLSRRRVKFVRDVLREVDS